MLRWFLRWTRLLAICTATIFMLATAGPSLAAAPGPRRSTLDATAPRGDEPTQGIEQLSPNKEFRPMTSSEEQGIGCIALGGLAMGLSAVAGFDELVLVFAGGAVVPTTTVGHVVAVAGMIFASFCAVGALTVPAFVYGWERNQFYHGGNAAPAR